MPVSDQKSEQPSGTGLLQIWLYEDEEASQWRMSAANDESYFVFKGGTPDAQFDLITQMAENMQTYDNPQVFVSALEDIIDLPPNMSAGQATQLLFAQTSGIVYEERLVYEVDVASDVLIDVMEDAGTALLEALV